MNLDCLCFMMIREREKMTRVVLEGIAFGSCESFIYLLGSTYESYFPVKVNSRGCS